MMLPLLRELLGLCEHQWEVFDRANHIDSRSTDASGRSVITGQIFYSTCKKCGKIKKRVL